MCFGLVASSTQFRKELSNIIWANIQLTTYSNQTLWYIPKFLEDGPLVGVGIKHLHISIDVRDGDDSEEFDPVRFENLCKLMVDKLRLLTMSLCLHINERQLDEAVWGQGKLDFLSQARQLVVSKLFEV